MYSPLNEQFMFQEMHDRTAAIRSARPSDSTQAGAMALAARDTRRWWRKATHRAR